MVPTLTLSHRIAMDPTEHQRSYFVQAAGTNRFTWNWGLAEWTKRYEAGEKPTGNALTKRFNAIRRKEFPWTYDVCSHAVSRAFADLQAAFVSWWRGGVGRPRFKKKGHRDSFYVANDWMRVDGRRVRIPRIGWVRLREELRLAGKIMGATVSREADRWFIAIMVEGDHARTRTGDGVAGVDLGLTTTATVARTVDGETTITKHDGPKPLRRLLKKLQRLSRQASRKVKGSANQRKAYGRLARLHRRIKDIRKDFIHKLTSMLCRENQAVVIEDLSVKGMLVGRLARTVGDAGFFEFKRQLGYKAPLHDTRLVVADRFYPSTKTCSACGHVQEMPLWRRTYLCESCGHEEDRDSNAARNLVTLGLRELACGDGSNGETDITSCEPAVCEAGTTREDARVLAT